MELNSTLIKTQMAEEYYELRGLVEVPFDARDLKVGARAPFP